MRTSHTTPHAFYMITGHEYTYTKLKMYTYKTYKTLEKWCVQETI